MMSSAIRRKHTEDAAGTTGVECKICKKRLSNRSSMFNHNKNVHKIQPTKRSSIACQEPNCGFTCNLRRKLRDHAAVSHKMHINIEKKEFKSVAEFTEWKSQVEKNHTSQYVKLQSHRTDSFGRTCLTLQCSRSGRYVDKAVAKSRSFKKQGTRKINGHCTSYIKYCVEPDGTVGTEFCLAHHGHTCDVEHLTLNKHERAGIASQLRQGIAVAKILDGIRESGSDKVERIHLSTRKDIANIRVSFGMNAGKQRNVGDDRSEELLDAITEKDLDEADCNSKPEAMDPSRDLKFFKVQCESMLKSLEEEIRRQQNVETVRETLVRLRETELFLRVGRSMSSDTAAVTGEILLASSGEETEWLPQLCSAKEPALE